MKENLSWLTPNQAGELIDLTGRQIQNLIKSGKIPGTKEDGRYYINKSDLFRIYPKAFAHENAMNTTRIDTEIVRKEHENELLKQLVRQTEKEVEFLRNQLLVSNREKEKMLDTITVNTRLLEHKKGYEEEKNNPLKWLNIFKKPKNE
jgi:hypothetical protein